MEIFSSLAGFDWVVLLIVGLGAGFGVLRGFIVEVASLAAWVAGFVAVRLLYTPARAILATATGSEMLASAAAVLGPFLLALLLVRLIGGFLSSSARGSVIGPFDRVLGLGFGVLKGVLAASLLFLLITLGLKIVPGDAARPAWLANAKTTPTLALVASAMVSYVGEAWRQQQDPHAGLPGFGDGPVQGSPADAGKDGGYGQEDRRSLDHLLDEQEQKTPSTAI